jgi:hypothetical protein
LLACDLLAGDLLDLDLLGCDLLARDLLDLDSLAHDLLTRDLLAHAWGSRVLRIPERPQESVVFLGTGVYSKILNTCSLSMTDAHNRPFLEVEPSDEAYRF